MQEHGTEAAYIVSGMLGLLSESPEQAVQYVEWFFDKNEVSIKPSSRPSILNLVSEFFGIKAFQRYRARQSGENVDSEWLMAADPAFEYQSFQRKDLDKGLYSILDILLAGLTAATSKGAATVGTMATNFLSAYFIPSFSNPVSRDWVHRLFRNLSSFRNVVNYTDLFLRAADTFETPPVKDDFTMLLMGVEDFYEISMDIAGGKHRSPNEEFALLINLTGAMI